jgi:ABC-2 type transport system permease protein
MVIIVPSLIAYTLGLLFTLDITILRDTFRILLASVVYGLVIAVSTGMLVLALSSLSRNSRYISLLWLAIWIGSTAVAGTLETAHSAQRMHQTWRARQAMGEDYLAAELEASKANWRPLVSYTANLSRVGQQLLGTDAAWEELSKFRPAEERPGFLLGVLGPQYPWYWSAGVLVGLLGLSVCILNLKIKSLDRLK